MTRKAIVRRRLIWSMCTFGITCSIAVLISKGMFGEAYSGVLKIPVVLLSITSAVGVAFLRCLSAHSSRKLKLKTTDFRSTQIQDTTSRWCSDCPCDRKEW